MSLSMKLKEKLKLISTSLSSKFYKWLLGREMFLKLLKKRHDKFMEYRVKKHILIRPIETFLTKSFPGVTSEQERMLATKRYYKFSEIDDFRLMAEYMSIYREVPGMKDLIAAIIQEHYFMTKKVDHNLHYLWYLYRDGTRAGEYRPFILMAEMQLLKELGYLTEDEVKNMCVMMESDDTDNLNLVYLSILNLRKQRIEDYGDYGKSNVTAPLHNIVQDYSHTIMSQELFMKYFTKTV